MSDVYEWNKSVAERDITLLHQNGLLYYCWWLTYQKGYKNLGCDVMKEQYFLE